MSALSLGTMTFGGDRAVRGVGLDEARRIVDLALDAGINLIDTADVYSNGDSERMVGELLSSNRRAGSSWRRRRVFRTAAGVNDEGLRPSTSSRAAMQA